MAVAFNAGNLKPVTEALRAKYPSLRIIVCADDDYCTDGNPGLTKAREAAQAVGGLLAIPDFGPDRPQGATDFNDMAAVRGVEAVRACIEATGQPHAEMSSDIGQRHEIERLAALSSLDYDRVRNTEAKRLGVRVNTLDAEVAKARKCSDPSAQGEAVMFEALPPWPKPVHGATLLDDMAATFVRYLVLPEHAAEVLALWVAHAHAFEAFMHSPRLNVYSPEKGCGKTLVLDVIQELAPRALRTENVTTAALFRLIEKAAPTLLIDEADTFLRDNEELRGALNAGHKRGGVHLRVEGEANEVKTFRTFAPVALAGIGNLPGTLADRSIVIRMKRALPGEVRERFDSRRTESEKEACRKLARWASDHAVRLADADPEMPEGFYNRRADNWRPLLAIADVAGGAWPDKARAAAIALSREDAHADSARVQLLADIRSIFTQKATERLLSSDLVTALADMEDRAWPEWSHGKPITARQVASLLRPFSVAPKTLRTNDERRGKGYEIEQFKDAFDRYTPPAIGDSVTTLENKAFPDNTIRDNEECVTDDKSQKPLKNRLCHRVTDRDPQAWEADL